MLVVAQGLENDPCAANRPPGLDVLTERGASALKPFQAIGHPGRPLGHVR